MYSGVPLEKRHIVEGLIGPGSRAGQLVASGVDRSSGKRRSISSASYSPDLNPIEIKACLRRVAERTVPRLYRRIGSFARSLTACEARNYFRHAGYA